MKTKSSLTGSAEAPSLVRLFSRPVLLLTVLALASLLGLPGYAVAPRLSNITPTGGQRGTEVNVVFSGQRLEDAQEVIFYTAGISVGKLDMAKDRVKAT